MKDFTLVDHFEDLDQESKYLAHKAQEALHHAYAPYSKFMVSVAIMLENGKIVTGTNQENAAYPSGMCAERVALFTVSSQYPNARITKMVVVAKRKNTKELVPATSCGACRQVMLEFEERQHNPIEVIMLSQDHQWVKAASAASLLPFCFTGANLKHEEKKH